MKSIKNKIAKLWRKWTPLLFGLFMGLGLIGFILLFPMDLDDNATCLYESIIQNDQAVTPVNLAQAVHGAVPRQDADLLSPEQLTRRMNYIRLHNYMNIYLLWWWGSTGLFIFGMVKLYKRRTQLKQLPAASVELKMGNQN